LLTNLLDLAAEQLRLSTEEQADTIIQQREREISRRESRAGLVARYEAMIRLRNDVICYGWVGIVHRASRRGEHEFVVAAAREIRDLIITTWDQDKKITEHMMMAYVDEVRFSVLIAEAAQAIANFDAMPF